MTSCIKITEDFIIVTSLDQIPGIWEWESSYGGITDYTSYSSDTNFGEIEFTLDNKLIQTRNDTIFLTANFTIETSDNLKGILTLVNIQSQSMISDSIQYANSIENSELFIKRGELVDTYKKIK